MDRRRPEATFFALIQMPVEINSTYNLGQNNRAVPATKRLDAGSPPGISPAGGGAGAERKVPVRLQWGHGRAEGGTKRHSDPREDRCRSKAVAELRARDGFSKHFYRL